MSTIIKVLIIIILVGLIAYGGLCVKANFFDQPATAGSAIKAPDVKEAQWQVYIRSTSQTYFTNHYSTRAVGNNTYTLHGFWYLNKEKYVYNKNDSPPLDEAVLGKIQITRRAP